MSISKGGSTSQWNRICVSVLGSMYFKTKIKYAQSAHNEDPCQYIEVTFRTAEAKRVLEMAPQNYYEWMIVCEAKKVTTTDEEGIHFFISRAYASNQVFVYSADYKNGVVYLENLSTNVSVIDDIVHRNSG